MCVCVCVCGGGGGGGGGYGISSCLSTYCSVHGLSVICDLGSARTLEHTARQTTAIGTDAWMAPEVGDGEHCYKSPLPPNDLFLLCLVQYLDQ